MAGVEAVVNKLGVELSISIEQRIAGAAKKQGEHKTLMLQDLEAARPMDWQLSSGPWSSWVGSRALTYRTHEPGANLLEATSAMRRAQK